MRADDEAEFKGYAAARMRDLRRTAFLLCGDWHHADDVVQTVFTKLYVNWEKVQRARSARRLRAHDARAGHLRPAPPPVVAARAELRRTTRDCRTTVRQCRGSAAAVRCARQDAATSARRRRPAILGRPRRQPNRAPARLHRRNRQEPKCPRPRETCASCSPPSTLMEGQRTNTMNDENFARRARLPPRFAPAATGEPPTLPDVESLVNARTPRLASAARRLRRRHDGAGRCGHRRRRDRRRRCSASAAPRRPNISAGAGGTTAAPTTAPPVGIGSPGPQPKPSSGVAVRDAAGHRLG